MTGSADHCNATFLLDSLVAGACQIILVFPGARLVIPAKHTENPRILQHHLCLLFSLRHTELIQDLNIIHKKHTGQ